MNASPISQHITLTRVAEMANTSPQNVSNWRRRSDDFPLPVAGTERRPLFDLGEMIHWLKANSHYDDNPGFATRLWAFMDGLRASVSPAEALQVALAAVAWRSVSDRLSRLPEEFIVPGQPAEIPEQAKAPAETVGTEDLEAALEHLEKWSKSALRTPYSDLFDPLLQSLPRVGAPFLSIILPHVLVSPADTSELEKALDDVLDRSNSQGILGRTSPLMRDLACSILDAQDHDTILDAACGSGSFLLHAGVSRNGTRCIGVDVSSNQLQIAAATALLAGKPLDLRLGDSITADPAAEVRAERVFIDPPFNLRIDGYGDLQGDPRWVFGQPLANLNLAWVQHAIARLTSDGRAVVVLPSGDLADKSGRKIRTELLKRGALEAVIALPRGSYPGMATAPTLWSLRAPNTPRADGLLLIEASDQDVTGPGSLNWVSQTIHEYRQGAELSGDRPRAAVLPIIDILAEDANVTPSRWLAEVSIADEETLRTRSSVVEQALKQVRASSWSMSWSVSEGEVPFVKLADLVSAGSLHIVKGRRPVTSNQISETGSTPVLTPAALMGGTSKQKYLDEHDGSSLTETGDIALWVTGSKQINATVLKSGGAVPGPNVQILRVSNSSFTPEYLATCLASAHNERFLQGSAILRPNLHQLEIPAVPLAEQRNVGEKVREIAQLQENVARLAAELEGFQELVRDGIGEGALRLVPTVGE